MDKTKSNEQTKQCQEKENTEEKAKQKSKKRSDTASISESTSHTQFFRQSRHSVNFKKVSRKDYYASESMSSTDTFHCFHKDGRQYSPGGLLKRNLCKELDPIPVEKTWTEECPPTWGWEISEKLAFLLTDPSAGTQTVRLHEHLRDFIKLSADGFRVDVLEDVAIVIEAMLDDLEGQGEPDVVKLLREPLIKLLKNMKKPIRLIVPGDIVNSFEKITHYLGFMGFLLIRVHDDELFDLVAQAIMWHLKCPDSKRNPGDVRREHMLVAAKILIECICRMLATISSKRFHIFIEIALLLASHSEENCIEMMKEEAVENLFYRFNPYFPHRPLPHYDINPANPQDINVKLGDSSIYIDQVMTILLVLLKTSIGYLEKHPEVRIKLHCPDQYSLRCFAWAYRYECLARGHGHQRIILTIIAAALVNCFRERITYLATIFLPGAISLSVLTEIPKSDEWIGRVTFNTMQQDVHFKKVLIYVVVLMLKMFPYNHFMVTSRHWLLGMMYLLDPSLGRVRKHWSSAHYAELRKIAFQALICTIPLCDPKLIKQYTLIRRLLWYIEWYTDNPYSITELYWCIRLLQTVINYRDGEVNKTSIRDLYDTHGIIILSRLCLTLMEQKTPPVEKSQAVIVVCLRMLSSAIRIDARRNIVCSVYPYIRWPQIVFPLAQRMMNIILCAMERHLYVSNRWLIAFLNFTWEAVIWNNHYREIFIEGNGVYMLLDLISVSGPSAQCMALALICDIVRSGQAVGQLITWRARMRASSTDPLLVKRGATIGTLLATIFREECQTCLKLSMDGVLEDDETVVAQKDSGSPRVNATAASLTPELHCIYSESAFEMAGSRRSKVFALLHMLSEDLNMKMELADETYNLYKNIILDVHDEISLVLCSHYLTMKINDTWLEVKREYSSMLPTDRNILNEFLQVQRGWNKEIKRQQQAILEEHNKKDLNEEKSLYAFIARIRLNIALDALKDVRCVARSADRNRITQEMLRDAVHAHRDISVLAKQMNIPILRTYKSPLDDANVIGQNITVCSIFPKENLTEGDTLLSSPASGSEE